VNRTGVKRPQVKTSGTVNKN